MLGYQRMRNANIGSYIYMNGGKLNVGTSLYLVYLTTTSSGTTYKATDGYMHMNGGTVDVTSTLSLCNDVNSTGRLFLNGGSISAKAISHNNGKAYVTFNGGTLVLSGANTFTGPTTIAGGVLQATADEALSGRVVVTPSGVLDCAGGTRTVSVPGSLKVLNGGGNIKSVKLKVVDGMLYAVAADSGTMVLFR